MSNKLKKTTPKSTPQVKKINEDDIPFVKFLKGRLEQQSDRSKEKRFLSSNSTYAIMEFLMLMFASRIFEVNTEGYRFGVPFYIYVVSVLFGIYNIIISIYQIKKLKYKEKQNIVLIVIHALLIILGLFLVFSNYF